MNNSAIFSLVFGILFIVVRGPLLIAPEKTRHVYKKLFKTSTRIRIVGLLMLTLSIVAIYSSLGTDQKGDYFILVLGLIIGTTSLLFFLIFTKRFKTWIEIALWSLKYTTGRLRIIGLINIGFGILLIYFGLAVF